MLDVSRDQFSNVRPFVQATDTAFESAFAPRSVVARNRPFGPAAAFASEPESELLFAQVLVPAFGMELGSPSARELGLPSARELALASAREPEPALPRLAAVVLASLVQKQSSIHTTPDHIRWSS